MLVHFIIIMCSFIEYDVLPCISCTGMRVFIFIFSVLWNIDFYSRLFYLKWAVNSFCKRSLNIVYIFRCLQIPRIFHSYLHQMKFLQMRNKHLWSFPFIVDDLRKLYLFFTFNTCNREELCIIQAAESLHLLRKSSLC